MYPPQSPQLRHPPSLFLQFLPHSIFYLTATPSEGVLPTPFSVHPSNGCHIIWPTKGQSKLPSRLHNGPGGYQAPTKWGSSPNWSGLCRFPISSYCQGSRWHATIVENPVTQVWLQTQPLGSLNVLRAKIIWVGAEWWWGEGGSWCVWFRNGLPSHSLILFSFFSFFLLLCLRGCVGNTSSARYIYMYLHQTPNSDIYHHRPLVALFQHFPYPTFLAAHFPPPCFMSSAFLVYKLVFKWLRCDNFSHPTSGNLLTFPVHMQQLV